MSNLAIRRSFFAALMTVAALVLAPESQARSRSSGSSRPSVSRSGRSSGGGSVGCGSRGGAGYRKANGKCAGRNE